jgi:hypothetical protein
MTLMRIAGKLCGFLLIGIVVTVIVIVVCKSVDENSQREASMLVKENTKYNNQTIYQQISNSFQNQRSYLVFDDRRLRKRVFDQNSDENSPVDTECTSDPSCQPSTEPADCILPVRECNPNNLVCTLELNPVCGCDHKTHSNACFAHYFGCVRRWEKGVCHGDSIYNITSDNSLTKTLAAI